MFTHLRRYMVKTCFGRSTSVSFFSPIHKYIPFFYSVLALIILLSIQIRWLTSAFKQLFIITVLGGDSHGLHFLEARYSQLLILSLFSFPNNLLTFEYQFILFKYRKQRYRDCDRFLKAKIWRQLFILLILFFTML